VKCACEMCVCVRVQPVTESKPTRRGRPPLTPTVDCRPEILKLSFGGSRVLAKQEDTCEVCTEGDGTLLHCNGPCLRMFHTKCIGLIAAPASPAFTCDECLTGMLLDFYVLSVIHCYATRAALARCSAADPP